MLFYIIRYLVMFRNKTAGPISKLIDITKKCTSFFMLQVVKVYSIE